MWSFVLVYCPCNNLAPVPFCSYDLTPSDSSAIFTLTCMAKVCSIIFRIFYSPASNLKLFHLILFFGLINLVYSLQQKQEQEMCMRSDFPSSPTRSPNKDSPHKPKRPMNAFMLFAKRYRMEYMQLYPGKDNR